MFSQNFVELGTGQW